MSTAIEATLNELRGAYDPQTLNDFDVFAPTEKAKRNAERVNKIARMAGGFAHYFVVGDEFHDEQHEAYCAELGIDGSLHPRTFPLVNQEGSTTVLRRTLQYLDDGAIHGINYDVEHIPFDRD